MSNSDVKDLPSQLNSYIVNAPESEDKEITADVRYICSSCSLITESLQKGSDVLQMPNGDIYVTEKKIVTFHYTWDEKKGKLVRVQSGHKSKKRKESYDEYADDEDFDLEDEMESVA